ncbi:MAG: hypothetical protein ABW252_12005 [Polyangiales bacterium]
MPDPSLAFASKPTPAIGFAAVPRFEVRFAYVGATALTVVGPISGRRYRFERPFAQLAVDPRDRPGLARLPMLRAVPPP